MKIEIYFFHKRHLINKSLLKSNYWYMIVVSNFLEIEDSKISTVKKFKLLGVHLDKLQFIDHAANISVNRRLYTI